MKSTASSKDGLWSATFGQVAATLKALQDHGVAPAHLERLRRDPDYAMMVAEFMLWCGQKWSIHQKVARAILGLNFLGPEEWTTFYGVHLTREQLPAIVRFPWNEDVLNTPCPFVTGRRVRDTHVAFLGLEAIGDEPLTIIQFTKLHPPTGQPKFYYSQPVLWYEKEPFAAAATCQFRWYLLLAEVIPGSWNKTYGEQLAMLPPEYEVPRAIKEVTKDLLYYQKTGVYLNPILYGRCRDSIDYSALATVGHFCPRGLSICGWDGGKRAENVGLPASRKLPPTIS